MKIVIIALRSADNSKQDFAPYLDAEAAEAFEHMEENFFRKISGLKDGRGTVIVVEAKSEEVERTKMAEMPLSKTGLLNSEIYPVKTYRGMEQAADLLRVKR